MEGVGTAWMGQTKWALSPTATCNASSTSSKRCGGTVESTLATESVNFQPPGHHLGAWDINHTVKTQHLY